MIYVFNNICNELFLLLIRTKEAILNFMGLQQKFHYNIKYIFIPDSAIQTIILISYSVPYLNENLAILIKLH